jgi:hypothetical protein
MNFDKLFSHDLPTGAPAFIGLALLFVVFKTGKLVRRLMFLLVAVGLFAVAYRWHSQT